MPCAQHVTGIVNVISDAAMILAENIPLLTVASLNFIESAVFYKKTGRYDIS